MSRRLVGWLAFWTSFGIIDWKLDQRHDGSTLSESTRYLFRTHTPTGQAAFTAALASGSFVLWRHILKPAGSVISS